MISSDCPNGPKEIISNDGGYLFKSKKKESFMKSIEDFLNESPDKKFLRKIILKKRTRSFTIFQHSKILKKILD